MAKQAVLATQDWLETGHKTSRAATSIRDIVSCQCEGQEKVARQGAAEDTSAKPEQVCLNDIIKAVETCHVFILASDKFVRV